MATFYIHSFTLLFHFTIFQFLTLLAFPISSVSLQTLANNPNFDPDMALLGDAKIVDDNSNVRLVTPSASSTGLLMHNKPFKFAYPNGSNTASFSTDFLFSITPGNGDGIAFVVFAYRSAFKFAGQGPFGVLSEKKYLCIEFDTKLDYNVGDVNVNHVGIDVDSLVSVSVSNVSSINLVLNNGEKLKSWIDYDLTSKRIEVRLSKFGESRPYSPILAYHIDLSKMWESEDVFVGIVSSKSNSEQISSIYSWNFRLKSAPYWMHSFPVDPRGHVNEHGERLREQKRSVCPLRVVAGLIFATGCGALLAFAVLLVLAIVENRDTVFPAECQVHPADFRYEKIDIIVEEGHKGIKN